MAVAVLWTLLAVSRTLLSDAELSQLTVKAANITLPPCTSTGCCIHYTSHHSPAEQSV